MRAWRIGAAVTAALLSVPAPATGAPLSGLAPAGSRPVAAVPAAQAAATVPCPRTKVSGAVTRPPRPDPPPQDPASRAVGGAALATKGLVVPSGARRPPALTATSWVVADLDSGAVLGGCGPHVPGTPASVQKLLLAATVMPELDPDRVVRVTRKDLDFEPGSSAVGLLEGGKYPIRTLWLGLLLNSGNDAANVLARVGGGEQGVPGTIAAMNTEARRLGALQTHAVTPSGLDGPGQFTSAYDLALIARACFAREDFREYALTERAQIPAQPPKTKRGFQIQNENQLIFQYPGALGGKTGFTTLARHTYVGAAERKGRRLVVALLGAEARPLRGWQQGAALLDWGFSLPRDAAVGELVEPGERTDAAPGSRPEVDADARGESDPGNGPAAASPIVGTLTGARSTAFAAGLAALLAAAPVVLLMSTRRRRLRHRRRPAG